MKLYRGDECFESDNEVILSALKRSGYRPEGEAEPADGGDFAALKKEIAGLKGKLTKANNVAEKLKAKNQELTAQIALLQAGGESHDADGEVEATD